MPPSIHGIKVPVGHVEGVEDGFEEGAPDGLLLGTSLKEIEGFADGIEEGAPDAPFEDLPLLLLGAFEAFGTLEYISPLLFDFEDVPCRGFSSRVRLMCGLEERR